MSKVLDRIQADPRVESVSDERRNGDGCWVYLLPAYICPAMECGTIHEDSWTACERMLKTARLKTPEERKLAGYPD